LFKMDSVWKRKMESRKKDIIMEFPKPINACTFKSHGSERKKR
jgi:hypothetical protein